MAIFGILGHHIAIGLQENSEYFLSLFKRFRSVGDTYERELTTGAWSIGKGSYRDSSP